MRQFDTVIVGGGPAGLSAALALGRSRRDVLVLDSGVYRNAPAAHSHNFFTQDGTSPADLRRIGREQLAAYPGVVIESAHVDSAAGSAMAFTLALDTGETVATRTLVLATGVRDELPAVPGMAELWGVSIHHCPYCHGWEVRDQALALYGKVEMAPVLATHMAPLLRNLSADIVMVTDGPAAFGESERTLLQEFGVGLDETPIARLVSTDGHLSAVEFTDGRTLPRQAMFAHPTGHPNTALGVALGCEVTTEGMRGLFRVDNWGATTIPGIFAAGDVATPASALAAAVMSGAMAGAGANLFLATSRHVAAVPLVTV